MKRTWTIIGVRDVAHSFKWYQSLFGQPETQPHHDYFGQLLDEDGTVLLCLHLGAVMALFATLPYGKFGHGIFRSAALLRHAIEKRQPNTIGLTAD